MSVVVASLSESKSGFKDYFELFGLPREFKLNPGQLEASHIAVMQETHPDRFASASDAEKRVALQMATYANNAYQTLRNPVKRGLYLCELGGLDPQLETNTAMPQDFLMQQMEWRESLDEARGQLNAVEALSQEVRGVKSQYMNSLESSFAEGDMESALNQLRCLLFMDKFLNELDDAIADLV